MKAKIEGRPSFAHIAMVLEPKDVIIAESDAMCSMDAGITQKARFNGGLFGALLRKFLGRESFFVNYYSNMTDRPRTIHFTQPAPGDIQMAEVSGGGFYLQPGAFICRTQGVQVTPKWAGIRSWFAREGLFRLHIHGKGVIWFGGYGNVYEKIVNGSYLVDTAHLLGYSPGMKMRIQTSGGLISSFTSGEGFLTRMEGNGKIWLQSRSLGGLASWLNPRI